MTPDFHGMLDPLKVPLGTLRTTDASIRKSYDVAVDSAGNLFIADTHNHVIRKVDAATGIITTVVGKVPVPVFQAMVDWPPTPSSIHPLASMWMLQAISTSRTATMR